VFVDSAHTLSNFGKLRVVTSGEYSDVQQLQAAGWLEGYLTAGELEWAVPCLLACWTCFSSPWQPTSKWQWSQDLDDVNATCGRHMPAASLCGLRC
jgi:hypothetical protein